MGRVWRVIVGVIAIFNILVGLGFLIDPATSALRFHLAPLGTQGMASLRADLTAFFVAAGGFAFFAAWRATVGPLLVPIVLFGIALFGRAISLVADSAAATAYAPMLTEAIMIAILVAARRSARGQGLGRR